MILKTIYSITPRISQKFKKLKNLEDICGNSTKFIEFFFSKSLEIFRNLGNFWESMEILRNLQKALENHWKK